MSDIHPTIAGPRALLSGHACDGVRRLGLLFLSWILIVLGLGFPGQALSQAEQCQYADDGECDEPTILGSGLCAAGSDSADCAAADAVAQTVLTDVEFGRLTDLSDGLGEAASAGGSIADPLLEAIGILQSAHGRGETEAGDLLLPMMVRLNDEGSRLRTQGDYRAAIRLFERGAGLADMLYGPDHPIVGRYLNNLGLTYQDVREDAAAELLFRQALEIFRQAHGHESQQVALALDNLAGLRRAMGDLGEAERLYREAVAILEVVTGPESLETSISLNNLAVLYGNLGDYPRARDLLQRVLTIREAAFGPDHRVVGTVLNNLAALYRNLGDWAEAEPLYLRALAIFEREYGPDAPDVATILDNLSDAYGGMGEYERAEPLLIRALTIRRAVFGPEHPETARTLNNLASHYHAIGAWEEAEALSRQALEIFERTLGPNHPTTATSLINLAIAQGGPGDAAGASVLLERAAAIRERALGRDHPDTASSLADLGLAYDAAGHRALAMDTAAAARDALRAWLDRLDADQLVGVSASPTPQDVLGDLLWLANRWEAEATEQAERDRWIRESFDIVQLLRFTATGQAIGRMAARFAAGDDALAGLVRDRQETAERLAALRDELLHLVTSASAGDGVVDTDALHDEMAALTHSLATQDEQIARDFPAYAALSRPRPLDLHDAQALLDDGEALVVFAVLGPVSYAWVVQDRSAAFVRLDVGAAELDRQVGWLRRWLDPAAQPMPVGGEDPLNIAHALYSALWKPLEPALSGASRVLVVPDGPLTSLPLTVLVSDPVAVGGQPADRRRRAAWLVHDYAFTTLPAVGSLHALRTLGRGAEAVDRFIGFGDPVLEGGRAAGIRAAGLDQRGIASTPSLRQLTPLPETADELRAVAASLEGWETALYLDAEATEAQVKALSQSGALGEARVLAFATHGLMSGDLRGYDEPGLVFTPPEVATEGDDGLLTAGEVAQLHLAADWVVLSACNTAGPDGQPSAEGLSGLARGFFYAGARSLLVSHWAVYSEAALALTTGTFQRLAAEPGLHRAEALRLTMLALIEELEDPHPAYWAPFVVVGEGGVVVGANAPD